MRQSFSPVIILAMLVATANLIGVLTPAISYSDVILFNLMVLIEISRIRYLVRAATH